MNLVMVFELSEIDMLRYVILKHDWNGVHYDLMLEQGAILKTWRLASPIQTGRQEAILLPDHRLEYLTYEGPISRDRGKVSRVAEGTFESALATEQSWNIVLEGTIRGSITLQPDAVDRWQLEWQPVK